MSDILSITPRRNIPTTSRKVVSSESESDTSEPSVSQPSAHSKSGHKSPKCRQGELRNYNGEQFGYINEARQDISNSEMVSYTNTTYNEQEPQTLSPTQTTSNNRKRGAKRAKWKESATSIAAQLQSLDEDIDKSRIQPRNLHSKLNHENDLQGQLVAQILVETDGGFTSNRDYFLTKMPKTDPLSPAATPEEFAKIIRTLFHKFTLIGQGLLAGACVWYIVMLTSYQKEEIIYQFGFAARAFQGIFAAIKLLALTGILESYLSPSGFSLNWKTVIFVSYLATLLISLSMVTLDDQMWLMSKTSSLILEVNITKTTADFDYETWYKLHYCRNVGAIHSFVVTILDSLIL